MIVYQSQKDQFLADNDDRDIEDVILQSYRQATGRGVAHNEIQSWKDSLRYMASVLRDNDIPDNTGVAVELHIPQSSKRIDVTLTGLDEIGSPCAVLVELKQWSESETTGKDGIVRTFLGRGRRETVHPSYQAWSYAALLEDFNEAVHAGDISLHPCAYLHNYLDDGNITDAFYQEHLNRAPVFLKGEDERKALRHFIKRHVKKGDAGRTIFELHNGRIRPSKELADSLAGLLRGNREFVLIDEQKEVFETAMQLARLVHTQQNARPQVMIVEGGPGTGKSVVAINLLVRIIGMGLLAKYVSKNAAPREVYQARLSGSMTKTRYRSLFVGSGAFVETPQNDLDMLIVDEAHRLREQGGLYGNVGEHQVKEIIFSSRASIFFIDESQQVTIDDVGSKETIKRFAKEKGAEVIECTLPSQFRCNGSDGYIAWLDDLLGIRETANKTLAKQEFEFEVFDNPNALHHAIKQRNGNNKARVVAGYCWPWVTKNQDPTGYDIIIGNYQRRWNLQDDGSLWIMKPNSIEEVGCIHTCQGLELEYVGVIIGPDLIVRDGLVVTCPDQRAKHDKTIFGYKKRLKEAPEKTARQLDLIIKNTYRTLMTRGMKGCYVYSGDEETRTYLSSRLTAS
ncbi:MAG: DNA/RNA helicase domain-containing protein [Orrella sp.]